MKTLEANQTTERQKTGWNLAFILEIDLPVSGTQRYATSALTIGGQTYLGLLRDVDKFARVLPTDVTEADTYPADDVTLKLVNIPGHANRPETLLDTDVWEGSIARVYAIFVTDTYDGGGAMAANERILLHTYVVEDIRMDGRLMSVRLADFTIGPCERRVGYAITNRVFPRADPAYVGRPLPHIFGDVKDCPLIPLDVGSHSTLDGSMTATQTYVQLRDLETADNESPHYFHPTPSVPITVQVEAEQIRVNDFDIANKRLLVALDGRGYGGTDAERHNDGAVLQEVLSDGYKFGVAAHQCKGVTNVKSGGQPISETPTVQRTTYDSQPVQEIVLTQIPAWTERSPSIQITRADGRLAFAASGSAENPVFAVHPDIQLPAKINKNNLQLVLTGMRNWTALSMGEIVKATLCIEYTGNPNRLVSTVGPPTDPPIWTDGEFEIRFLREGTTQVGSQYLNAPRAFVCRSNFEGAAFDLVVQIGRSTPTGFQTSLPFFMDDTDGNRHMAVRSLVTDLDAWWTNQTYSITGEWIGYWFATTDDPGPLDWALEYYWVYAYDGGEYVFAHNIATNMDTLSFDQGTVFNSNTNDGLWNMQAYCDTYVVGGVTYGPSDTQFLAAISKELKENDIYQKRDIEELRIRANIYYPWWNRANSATVRLTLYSPAGGWAKDFVFECTQVDSTWVGAQRDIVFTIPKHQLNSMGIVTVGDLGDAWVTVETEDVWVQIDYLGNYYADGQYLLTTLRVEAVYDDSLYGADNALDGAATGDVNNPWASSPRATQRIDLAEIPGMANWIDDYGWDMFNSDTQIRIAASATTESEAAIYRVWWEIEHRPTVRRSGFGQLTADVQGYKTAGGALIENPADVVCTLLTNKTAGGTAVTDADFAGIDHATYLDGTSFVAARERFAALAWNLARRIDTDDEIRDLIATAAGESRLRVHFDGGSWFAAYLEDVIESLTVGAPTIDESLTLRELDRRFTPTSQLANRLMLRYRWDMTNGMGANAVVQREDAPSQSEPWGLRPKTFDLLWHQSSVAATVENLAIFYLSRLANKRMIARVQVPMRCIHLERGDVVPLSSTRGRLYAASAEILGWRLNGLSRLDLSMLVGPSLFTVFWESGLCRILVESGEAAIQFWRDDVMLARLDFEGNLELKGQLAEGDPTDSPTTTRASLCECDGTAGALRINTGSTINEFRGALMFMQNGDLEFDSDFSIRQGEDPMGAEPQSATIWSSKILAITHTIFTLRGVVVARIYHVSGGARWFVIKGAINENALG